MQIDGGTSSGDTSFTTISTQSDNIGLDTFTTDPVEDILVVGDIYRFRVIARNAVGQSDPSGIFEAMAAIKPGAPVSLTRKTSTTSSITLQWLPPLDDGGDEIDDYKVYWD